MIFVQLFGDNSSLFFGYRSKTKKETAKQKGTRKKQKD